MWILWVWQEVRNRHCPDHVPSHPHTPSLILLVHIFSNRIMLTAFHQSFVTPEVCRVPHLQKKIFFGEMANANISSTYFPLYSLIHYIGPTLFNIYWHIPVTSTWICKILFVIWVSISMSSLKQFKRDINWWRNQNVKIVSGNINRGRTQVLLFNNIYLWECHSLQPAHVGLRVSCNPLSPLSVDTHQHPQHWRMQLTGNQRQSTNI